MFLGTYGGIGQSTYLLLRNIRWWTHNDTNQNIDVVVLGRVSALIPRGMMMRAITSSPFHVRRKLRKTPPKLQQSQTIHDPFSHCYLGTSDPQWCLRPSTGFPFSKEEAAKIEEEEASVAAWFCESSRSSSGNKFLSWSQKCWKDQTSGPKGGHHMNNNRTWMNSHMMTYDIVYQLQYTEHFWCTWAAWSVLIDSWKKNNSAWVVAAAGG